MAGGGVSLVDEDGAHISGATRDPGGHQLNQLSGAAHRAQLRRRDRDHLRKDTCSSRSSAEHLHKHECEFPG